MKSHSESTPRKARLFRFSLRTLLVVMLVAGIFLAWFGKEWSRVRRQRVIVQELKVGGAQVYFDYQREGDKAPNLSRLPRAWAVLKKPLADDWFAHVDLIYLTGRDPEIKAKLGLLPELPKLRGLAAYGYSRIDDDCLRQIAKNEALEGLNLAECQISAVGLAHLEAMPKLTELTLRGDEVTDDLLQGLPQLSRLTRLQLVKTRVTSQGLQHVTKLKQLESVDIFDNLDVGDEGVAYLASLTELKSLELLNTAVTSASLAHLAKMQQLHRLSLQLTKVTDEGLEHLTALSSLTILNLGATQVGDDSLKHIGTITSLQHLSLGSTRITDDGLSHLATLRELRYLNVGNTGVTGDGLMQLAPLKSLEDLTVGPHVTEAAARRLQERLPHCSISGSDPMGNSKSFFLRGQER